MELHNFRIELATNQDVPLILALIRELADHELMPQSVTADENNLSNSLFGRHIQAEVLIGYYSAEAVSYALFFPDFSSFSGQAGIHLDDLYVRPRMRRRGSGLNDGRDRQACTGAQLLPPRLVRSQNQSVGRQIL